MAGDQDQTESKKGRPSKRKPSRPKQSEFVPSPFDKMRPLHPGKQVLESAKSAFAILGSEYPRVLEWLAGSKDKNREHDGAGVEVEHPAFEWLRDLAHTYWFGHRVYERKSSAEFNGELKKIQKATGELSNILAKAPAAVQGRLSYMLQAQFSGDPIWPSLAQQSGTLPALQKVRIVLDGLTAASKKSVEKAGQPGARPKEHLRKATSLLVALWCSSGNDFKRSFRRAKGKGPSPALEFISAGPQFVWRIVSEIDSDLSINEVRAMLKNAYDEQSKMSGNPSRSRPKIQTGKRVL
ncbi:MAG: hypothetical protein WA733_13505 [Methylocystis sp.]|jgi:hypothetical protein